MMIELTTGQLLIVAALFLACGVAAGVALGIELYARYGRWEIVVMRTAEWTKFHDPTAGSAGNANTAEATDAPSTGKLGGEA